MVLSLLSGCYYGHLAQGQTRLLAARRPVEEVMAAPDTPATLKQQLDAIGGSRQYAKELGLDVKDQYTDYVAWPHDRIITSLVVTEPGSVEAFPFSYLFVGELPYRGFFDQERAEREAESFRQKGYDVCLLPVPAYSTLGFFADPITDPMLRGGEGPAVETVLHEFVHATVFVDNDADLNESAATFIGEEASVSFFAPEPAKAEQRRKQVEDKRMIRTAILAFRQQLKDFYERPEGTDPTARRAAMESEFRRSVAQLPLSTRDAGEVAKGLRANDACLALAGTYSADIPEHQRVFQEMRGDLPAYIARLKAAAVMDDPRAAFFGPADLRPGPSTE